MLRKLRISFAVVVLALITLLFLDFTGTIHAYFGWLAKIQLLPAILALNFGVVAALIVLTLVFGRLYCSVICPLGIMQDVFGRLGRIGKKNKYRYSFSKNHTILRVVVLVLFIIFLLVPGIGAVAHLIAPYSAFGRIAANILAPVYALCNNGLAYIAERMDSYAFYSVDVWIKSVSSLVIATITLVVLAVLAWRNGRTWCNNICPVGTVLGYIAKFSIFKPVIDTEKCNGCGLCARTCKAACINTEAHEIDYSRCVTCFNCVETCNRDAMHYTRRKKTETESAPQDDSRRKFLSVAALLTAGTMVKAQTKKVDGGLAVIQDKKIPTRTTPPKPAGSQSLRHFTKNCTACQLCVSVCPNHVLRPSNNLETLMQPEMQFEDGFCRPECVRCSEVCPTGAIQNITPAEKSAIQIGHAVWIKENCIVETDGEKCGSCASHCPVGAILMVVKDEFNPVLKIPVVNTERCIGCGQCEYYCPARPLSAIYIEGNEVQREI